LLVAAIARMSSLASLVSVAVAPIAALFLADTRTAGFALVIALMIVARHHENIRRLLAGTEPRIGERAKAGAN
jgi:glycerol-3-phosphate acyltransferase PlsY